MPNFFEINNSNENTVELLNNFIEELSLKTNRNVIIYYSGWLSTSVLNECFAKNYSKLNYKFVVIHTINLCFSAL